MIESSAAGVGVVLSASRRHVMLSHDRLQTISGTVAVRDVALLVGDEVDWYEESGEVFVSRLHPRRNMLTRSYRGEARPIVANIDRLLVVTAVPPLLNTLSIDRMSVVAHSESIPLTLVLNKIDLGVEPCRATIETYERSGMQVLQTAAKFGSGLDALRDLFSDPGLHTIALCGLSGVGKSTLINRLIPDASRTTAEVSERTGQGKQTTTQATGFLFPRPESAGLLVVDLPGIQQFGVEHLSVEQVAAAFPEIQRLASKCEFSNCGHIAERHCAVRDAVGLPLAEGGLASSRYESYCHMCKEINDAKPY